ncbi:hypothetical protein V8E36_003057 [Tilletia maclaganii]
MVIHQCLMDGKWAHALRDYRASPMAVTKEGAHAFASEPVELEDYHVFLVSAWVQYDGQLHGMKRRCFPSAHNGRFDVIATGETMFRLSRVRQNDPRLVQARYKYMLPPLLVRAMLTFTTKAVHTAKHHQDPKQSSYLMTMLHDLLKKKTCFHKTFVTYFAKGIHDAGIVLRP